MEPNQTVLVTGASTGIGEAVAYALDDLGFTVYAGVRKPEDGERVKQGASERLVPVQLDVAKTEDIEAVRAQLTSATAGHGLAGLVNNAGIATPAPLEFLEMESLRQQFEVNVFGLFAVTKALIPLLRQGKGRIVNIGSIAGRSTTPINGAYSASKHAVEAFTDAWRMELGKWGIEVTCVQPGAVKTPIWQKSKDRALSELEQQGPEAKDRYGDIIQGLVDYVGAAERKAVSARRVAEAVVHAMTAPKPKIRYLIGNDAKLRAWLDVLPARWVDARILSQLRKQ